MTDAAKPAAAPEILGGVAPYLMVSDANAASEFYQRAFGAAEVARAPADANGRLIHVHLHINGGSVMLSDPFPEHGHPYVAPQAFTLHLQVKDIDTWFQRAVDAGGTVALPVQLMFWGDRYGQVRDPFGVLWSMGQAS
jgi:PhnB protein